MKKLSEEEIQFYKDTALIQQALAKLSALGYIELAKAAVKAKDRIVLYKSTRYQLEKLSQELDAERETNKILTDLLEPLI